MVISLSPLKAIEGFCLLTSGSCRISWDACKLAETSMVIRKKKSFLFNLCIYLFVWSSACRNRGLVQVLSRIYLNITFVADFCSWVFLVRIKFAIGCSIGAFFFFESCSIGTLLQKNCICFHVFIWDFILRMWFGVFPKLWI